MVDFETIGKVSYPCSSLICVGYYNDFVSSVDKLRGELIDMAFHSSRLWIKKVADHGDIVRHDGYFGLTSWPA